MLKAPLIAQTSMTKMIFALTRFSSGKKKNLKILLPQFFCPQTKQRQRQYFKVRPAANFPSGQKGNRERKVENRFRFQICLSTASEIDSSTTCYEIPSTSVMSNYYQQRIMGRGQTFSTRTSFESGQQPDLGVG